MMQKSNPITVKPRGDRSSRGFSLLELMLVLAIMVLFAALSAPTVFQMIRSQNLSKSGDLVRAQMSQARVKAIRTGQIHAFYLVTNESWFSVAPFSQVGEMANRASQAISRSEGFRDDFDEELLPIGIKFGVDETELDPRAMQVLSIGSQNSSVKPVLFYPDGTSQSTRVRLVDDRGNQVLVELRGLTGTARVRRIGPEE